MSHHRISSADSKFRTASEAPIIHSGSERVNAVLQRVCANVTRNPITIYLCKISNTERSVLTHIKHRVLNYFTKRTELFFTSLEVFESVTKHSDELLFRCTVMTRCMYGLLCPVTFELVRFYFITAQTSGIFNLGL